MNFNSTLSILVHKGVLTLEEGEYLADQLAHAIQTQDFTDAHKRVEKFLEDFKAKDKKSLHK